MSTTLIPRSTLPSEVCTRLRNEIIEAVWKPGVRLQERILTERYGVSRSPLREAFQSLASEGLIELTANRGAVVTTPTLELAISYYNILRVLETLAIELACDNASNAEIAEVEALNDQMKQYAYKEDSQAFFHANNEVHRKIVEISGNVPLADTHLVISRQIIRIQNLNGLLEHSLKESIDEHDETIAGLKKRDKEKASQSFSKHLKTVEDNLRSRLTVE
ncbi:GntR family transcriptional regulator [Kordiimonas pumila]|uniref:GntR family transcriptional regulator n=1 Tax=Kordiimonas pumila TaxID=2161677 RepID=A0ABV7D5F0_9PROT|nr:GntR family transcriptional regulator [Kordiimonas pumila]